MSVADVLILYSVPLAVWLMYVIVHAVGQWWEKRAKRQAAAKELRDQLENANNATGISSDGKDANGKDANGKDAKTTKYQTNAHIQSHDELAYHLNTNLQTGLSTPNANQRLLEDGPNRLSEVQKPNKWLLLFQMMFGAGFNWLLWLCVAAEFGLMILDSIEYENQKQAHEIESHKAMQKFGRLIDENGKPLQQVQEPTKDLFTPIILAFVIMSASILQWWSEQKAESMMESLSQMQAEGEVMVIRGERNAMSCVPSKLVVGDVVQLEAGMKVPADGRVLYNTDGAEVDQAALTGESVPENKTSQPMALLADNGIPPATEARNMLFLGTSILKGNFTFVVTHTGDRTLLGSIAAGMRLQRPPSSLEIAMEKFVHVIAWIAVAVGLFTAVVEWRFGQNVTFLDILEKAAPALFSQIPEGLLPTATIALLIASTKMAQSNVLIRKLDAVETLGCCQVRKN
jgi:magnesium-transporting ATPase (P-type)